jgi:Glycosyltransferases involved in cell wall biogenesis
MISNMKLLSVIVPAYNEQNTVVNILDALLEVELIGDLKMEIVVVNDASTDRTAELVQQYIVDHRSVEIQYIEHDKNRGKGAALHSGIEVATGDLIIVQDADLEYDPHEFNILLKPILQDRADVVYGSRFVSGRPHRIMFFWHSIGNRILTVMSNMMTNLNLTDMETCYKLFRADHLKSLQLNEKRFGFEPEVTIKISRIPNIRIYEVGVSYYGRTFDEGKKINYKDGFRAIYCIIKYGLFRI